MELSGNPLECSVTWIFNRRRIRAADLGPGRSRTRRQSISTSKGLRVLRYCIYAAGAPAAGLRSTPDAATDSTPYGPARMQGDLYITGDPEADGLLNTDPLACR